MKAICLTGREHIEIRDVDDIQPGPGEVAITSDYVGLCGTDQHVFLGQFEERVPYPAVMGHEFGGRVAGVGEGVESFKPGDRVVVDPVFPCGECPLCKAGKFNICLDVDVLGLDSAGALAERVVVDATNVLHLPESVAPEHAPMAELYSVGVHSARITKIGTGDVVAVIGAGRLGLSLLDVMSRSGAASIVSIDILAGRLAVARELGADLTVNSLEEDPVEKVKELTGGLGADKVIEAVGHARSVPDRRPPMMMAVAMLRPGGQITAMGQGEAEEPFLWRPLVLKEATVVSSRLNLGEVPRAVELMASGRVHPGKIITHTVGPDEVQRGFEMMQSDPDNVIKVVVDMAGFGGG